MIVRSLYLQWKRLEVNRFLAGAQRGSKVQHAALLAKTRRNATSDFGRQHGFGEIHSVADFRRQMPITDYEYYRPYIERVMKGDVSAMFAPETRILMFTMTSGTTGAPKHLPVTEEFFRDYKRGWHLWGTGVFYDHRELLFRKALQLTSDWQQYRTESGVPCGNISGLAAETRPLIASIPFCFPTALARIHNSAAKHYATLRVALTNPRVGMLVTANPSTLVEFARRADHQSELLVRDIHDGTLNDEIPVPQEVRHAIRRWLRPRRRRARQLEKIIGETGRLGLRDAWPLLKMIAVWTGGSVGVYLPRLKEYYGETAIRDHGLSASEGRMTIPIEDGSSAGLLDYRHQFFEFIPEAEHGSENPTVLEAHELEEGQNYFILLTTSGGLYRYDIHDVVRCVGFIGQTPLLEFLNKSKHFASITGEKLSEHQVVQAVTKSLAELDLPVATFTLAPVMEEQPRYILLVEPEAHGGRPGRLAENVQSHLTQLNLEYADKCSSGRLSPIRVQEVPAGTWAAMRHRQTGQRGNFEEYKHPCLTSDLDFISHLAAESRTQARSEPSEPKQPVG